MRNKLFKRLLFFVGINFIIAGIIFKLKNYPDPIYSIYSGTFILLAGTILSIIPAKKKASKKLHLLSSNVTFAYKFILPIIMAIAFCFFTVGILFLFPKDKIIYFLALDLLFGTVFSIFIIKLGRIKSVQYSDTHLHISNYFSVNQEEIRDVKTIESYWFYFYKIKFRNSGLEETKAREIVFMPHIFDVFANFPKEPITIKTFRKLLIP